MQTFLPLPDARGSASVLDDRRLGKQRVEVLQILRALHLPDYGWSRHPAVLMWRGHAPALVAYGLAVVDEWAARGHDDRTRALISEFTHPRVPAPVERLVVRGAMPPWWGWDPLHRSHRSALLRKDPAHYRPHFPDVPDDLDYVWPAPPAGPPSAGGRSAWVVRGRATGTRLALPLQPWDHDILDGATRRRTKRARQLRRFLDELTPGDIVVLPDGDRLHVGLVAAGPVDVDLSHMDRPVTWAGELERRALGFPAALQDPQSVFPLHDEPSVEAVAAPSR